MPDFEDPEKPQAKEKAAGPLDAAACSRRFKIVGNYLYPPIESTDTFGSKEEAASMNQNWKEQAEAQGLRWKGRVVAVENATMEAPNA